MTTCFFIVHRHIWYRFKGLRMLNALFVCYKMVKVRRIWKKKIFVVHQLVIYSYFQPNLGTYNKCVFYHNYNHLLGSTQLAFKSMVL